MNPGQQRFFIALLPPEDVRQIARQIEQRFATVYNSRAVQKSPPHITLQLPFHWSGSELPNLQQKLTKFALTQNPIPVTLDGFGAFSTRVIYINVIPTPELLTIQKKLSNYLQSSCGIMDTGGSNRHYTPHITLAFRDLTKQNFRKAWSELEHQQLYFEFIVPVVTLLIHNGKRWHTCQEFVFNEYQ